MTSLFQLAIRSGDAVRKCCTASMARHGLRPRQYQALETIAAQPGLNQRDLAVRLGIDSTTIGAVIVPMIDQGLICRDVAGHDKRGYAYQLSAAGRTRLDVVTKELVNLEAIIDGLDASRLEASLAKLIEYSELSAATGNN